MKKALALILTLVMLLSCMSVTAFAADNNTTEITATVANSLSYEMVIPSAVSMTEAGVKEIGTPSVTDVKHATDDTVISYKATGTQLTLVGGTATMATSYYTNSTGTTPMPSTAIEVYKSKALVDPLTTLYVSVAQEAWDAAENGTYKATVTFNFSAEEKAATCEVDTETNTQLYRVIKIDDENVYLAIYSSYDGFDAVWSVYFSMPKNSIGAVLGTEYAVGDCFHILEESAEKCIAPETHGLYNEVVIGSLELDDQSAYLFVVPAGATYSIDDNKLCVHYGEKQHYVGGGQCSWALNGVQLSNGATGTISEGDAFVGTDLQN